MPPRRYISIIIHRDGSLRSTNLRLPEWAARTLAVIFGTVAVSLLVTFILYAPIARTLARVPGLEREVERLRLENERVVELAAALDDMEQRYEQLRSMLGGRVLAEPDSLEAEIAAGIRGEMLISIAPIEVFATDSIVRYDPATRSPRYWPLEVHGIVTQGHSDQPVRGGSHPGVDVAVSMDTPFRAAASGVVTDAGRDREYGLFVRLEHDDGYETLYGHASRIVVSHGDTVAAGQVLGLTGSTGRSTGPHLHFEVILGGRSIDPRTVVMEAN